MDCFSCTPNRQIVFSTTRINQNCVLNRNTISKTPAMIVGVEGNFMVSLDGEVFLEDDYMCVLELGVQLSTWLNQQDDFCYDSMSSEDKYILKFITISETEYVVSSSWSELKAFIVTKDELFEAVSNYIENTNVLLTKLFDIKISDFVSL